MADNSTQIDELRLDITVEDKTSGESSDKKVRALATAISRLNSIVNKFDSAKMSNVFANMAKGIEPFVSKIKGVEKALNSLGDIAKKGGFKEITQATKNISIGKERVETQSIAESSLPKPSNAPSQELEETTQSAMKLEKAILKISNGTKQLKLNVSAIKNGLHSSLASGIIDATSKIDILKIKLQMVNDALKKRGLTDKQIIALKEKQLSLEEQIKNINQDQSKSSSKSRMPLSKLIKQFGRVAMYRAIRTVLKEITQAIQETADGIASISPEFRATISQVNSDVAKLKASIGVVFASILSSFAPQITNISNTIAQFASNLSLAMSTLTKSGTYYKINTEYLKEYQSALNGTLLEFDTFTTLGKSQNSIDWKQLVIPEDVKNATAEERKEAEKMIPALETIKEILSDVWKALGTIWNDIAKPILDSGAGKFILDIVAGLVKLLSNAGMLKTVLVSIFAIKIVGKISDAIKKVKDLATGFSTLTTKVKNYSVEATNAQKDSGNLGRTVGSLTLSFAATGLAVMEIVKNWDKMSSEAKTAVIAISIITAAVAALAFAMYAASYQWGKAVSVAGGVIATGATVAAAVAKFEDGGIMEGAGTMYALAGEAGPEVVAKGSAGTGVLNVEQFSDAMVSALVRYGAARDNGGNGVIEIDGNRLGTYIAGNKGFRNEANRRNTNLNWK